MSCRSQFKNNLQHTTMEDKDYIKKCHIIEKLIKSQFPELEFKMVFNDSTNHYVILLETLNGKKAHMSIVNTDWKHLKKGIELKINNEYTKAPCSICYEDIKINISCDSCHNNWCSECYIELFKTGEGIIKCPWCRHTIGTRIESPVLIELGVREIRSKLSCQ